MIPKKSSIFALMLTLTLRFWLETRGFKWIDRLLHYFGCLNFTQNQSQIHLKQLLKRKFWHNHSFYSRLLKIFNIQISNLFLIKLLSEGISHDISKVHSRKAQMVGLESCPRALFQNFFLSFKKDWLSSSKLTKLLLSF